MALNAELQERLQALATLQILGVEAKQTRRDMNVSAMRTCRLPASECCNNSLFFACVGLISRSPTTPVALS